MNIANEIWTDVHGYEGLYQVSNMGRVKSLVKPYNAEEIIVKLFKNNKGYVTVNLWRNRKFKTKLVHRLVAEHFVPRDHGNVVNHKDYNKDNNTAENLEWCTQKENLQYSLCHRPLTKKNAPLPNTGEKYVHKATNRPGYYVAIHRPRKTTRYFRTLEEAIKFRSEYYGWNKHEDD